MCLCPEVSKQADLHNHTHPLMDFIHACSHTHALSGTKVCVHIIQPGSLVCHTWQGSDFSHLWRCSWQGTTNQFGVAFHTIQVLMFTIFSLFFFLIPCSFQANLMNFGSLSSSPSSSDIFWHQSCSSSSWYLICRSDCSSSCYFNKIMGR